MENDIETWIVAYMAERGERWLGWINDGGKLNPASLSDSRISWEVRHRSQGGEKMPALFLIKLIRRPNLDVHLQ